MNDDLEMGLRVAATVFLVLALLVLGAGFFLLVVLSEQSPLGIFGVLIDAGLIWGVLAGIWKLWRHIGKKSEESKKSNEELSQWLANN